MSTMHPRDQFPRTKCACDACRLPCHYLPGMLTPGDIERIAAHLGETPAEVEKLLEASPGAKVAKLTRKGVVTFRIPTIVPMLVDEAEGTPGKRCVFLQDNGDCGVWPVAPFGCSHCDDHMSQDEGIRRSAAALLSIMHDEAYKAVWQRLQDAGQVSESPEAKRARMKEQA